MSAALVGASVTVAVAPAEAAKVTVRLKAAINHLPVAAETRTGYTRTKFKLWIDADGDCQDTRSEVLRAETLAPVTGRCAVVTGKWKSYYDGATWTRASDVDIDHVVPLAEAWDSGARRWDAATRKAYANDLGDPRTLVAVTDNVNQAKGDKDPAEWMPTKGRCRYVTQWVAVKIRWSLKVNQAEKNALARVAGGCKDRTITVRKASIHLGSATVSTPCPTVAAATPTPTPTPALTPAPTAPPAPATPVPVPEPVYVAAVYCTPTPTPSLDPRYSTCAEAKSHGYGPYYKDRDPEYYWYTDADHDGKVCE